MCYNLGVKTKRQRFLVFLLISAVFASLGFFLGTLALDRRQVPRLKDRQSLGKGAGEAGQERSVSLSGRVESLARPAGQASHRLVGEEGKVVALLVSPKIDLDFLQGLPVEVEGEILKAAEGGVKLVRVEKVKFR